MHMNYRCGRFLDVYDGKEIAKEVGGGNGEV